MGKIRGNGRAMSLSAGLTLAGSVSLGVTAVGSLALAAMLDRGTIDWEQTGYWILGLLLAASFLGSKCAIRGIRRMSLAAAVMSALVYWGSLLLITALFFGGQYQGIGETAGAIAAGSGCAALLKMPKKSAFSR